MIPPKSELLNKLFIGVTVVWVRGYLEEYE